MKKHQVRTVIEALSEELRAGNPGSPYSFEGEGLVTFITAEDRTRCVSMGRVSLPGIAAGLVNLMAPEGALEDFMRILNAAVLLHAIKGADSSRTEDEA